MTYIIITTCRNEEKNIEKTILSVLSQSIKPSLWIISDNRSTDNTRNIIYKYSQNNSWIIMINKEKNYKNISHLEKDIYKTAIEICKKNKIKFDYIANLDSDIILDKNYYEIIIKYLNTNTNCVIARGKLITLKKQLDANNRDTTASGAISVYRKKFLKQIKGIPIVPYKGWDSLLVIKAIYKKYTTKTISNIKAIHLRPLSTSTGTWDGWKKSGKSAFFFRVPVFYAIGKGVKYILSKRFVQGTAYIAGYVSSMMKREKKIHQKYAKIYNNIILKII